MMLKSGQKKALRSYGHHLKAYVQVGKEGLSQAVVDSLDVSLTAHELVKVAALKTCPAPMREVALVLAESTHSEVVQIVGHTCLLYRKSEKNLLGHLL